MSDTATIANESFGTAESERRIIVSGFGAPGDVDRMTVAGKPATRVWRKQVGKHEEYWAEFRHPTLSVPNKREKPDD